ncbi:MAG: hypothetical protein FJ128_09945 [Deltaproteobacteria bacterium]|nr:hypothetical protein [Deltaproteobacteria bacterium]
MREFVWLNEALIPLDQARVPVDDRGFLYGDGLFETLRAEAGRVLWLPRHLARLEKSALALRLPFPADIPWEDRLARLLQANRLEQGLAVVKMLLSRGVAPGVGLPPASRPTLLIWARSYVPPTPEEYVRGWPVLTFPEPRTTFLGRHKSLNYLFYLAARQYALDRGAREALILEADGRISEGAATSLIVLRDGGFFTPQAPSALPGVTLEVLGQALRRRGQDLVALPVHPAQLREAAGLWLANSLVGVVPAASLDDLPLPVAAPATRFLQECLRDEH